MRIDDERVAHRDLGQSNIRDVRARFAMRNGGHAFRQSRKHRRGTAQGITLQRLATCEHEHDDGACEILAKHDRGDDGDTTEQIGAKLTLQQLPQQIIEHRQSANDERDEQRKMLRARFGIETETQHEMRDDSRE